MAVSKEIVDKTIEALRLAKQSGVVRKGANEATKSIERGLALLVAVADDVEPKEVVIHFPMLCDQRKVTLVNIPTKLELGKAIGLNVPCAAVAIEKGGEADQLLKEITGKTTGRPAQNKPQSSPTPKENKPKQESKKVEKQ